MHCSPGVQAKSVTRPASLCRHPTSGSLVFRSDSGKFGCLPLCLAPETELTLKTRTLETITCTLESKHGLSIGWPTLLASDKWVSLIKAKFRPAGLPPSVHCFIYWVNHRNPNPRNPNLPPGVQELSVTRPASLYWHPSSGSPGFSSDFGWLGCFPLCPAPLG